MYKHMLIPVDCTEESRNLALTLAAFAGPLISCRLTLAVAVTPTDDPELRERRRIHAEQALTRLHALLLDYGLWTRGRVLETSDPATAIAQEATDPATRYDIIVCGTHQTLPDEDEPCRGSLVDRISKRTHLPVLVLPARPGRK